MNDLVSIIVPVYNTEKYLNESITGLINQTYKNIEIICVDDGSTDNSLEILKKFQEDDKRLKILTSENKGAGAARNLGIDNASGKYIYFFDSDDIAALNLIEKSLLRANETSADMVAFNGYTFSNGDIENKIPKRGYNKNIVKDKYQVFSYQDYPESILSIVNVVPWNKLIRAEFIRKNNIRFEEISSSNDITFSALCSAYAKKIAVIDEPFIYYRLGHSGTVSSTKAKNLKNVISAVESVIKQAEKIEYFDLIKPSIIRFAADNYCFAFLNYTSDFSSQQVCNFYNFIQKRFNSEFFENVKRETFASDKIFALFNTVKSVTYENMALREKNKDIVVSFTTYPKRISTAHKVVENLKNQSMRPAQILLYLASEQFPGKEDDLPENLLALQKNGDVKIKWCDDLRSHKKYFYAMQEYPNSLIVTVDDDLIYPNNLILNLYHSYLCFPNCVSASRTHMILTDDSKKEILPYNSWIGEYKQNAFYPSFHLFATSGAGTLYPPGAISKQAFIKDDLLELCPTADDIWLYGMQLMNKTKTVLANPDFVLKYIGGTQDETLQSVNVFQNKNEEQFENLIDYSNRKLEEKDYIFNTMLDFDDEIAVNSMVRLSNYVQYKLKIESEFNHLLKTVYKEKSEINSKLRQAYADKYERGLEIKKLKYEKSRMEVLGRKVSKIINKFKFILPIYKVFKKLFHGKGNSYAEKE
ncbi:MAG: glycosyltransferase [Clostridiales bacterium]|nr:glycosyltransferase [Clostridiales bacterium]